MPNQLRVITYNIRKGKGANGRLKVALDELGGAIASLGVDLLLCQEVFHSDRNNVSQSAHLAQVLGFNSYYGANRFARAGHHGNATLTSLSLQHFENHNISTGRLDQRGALYVALRYDHRPLHVFNVHLGLSQRQRTKQMRQIESLVPEKCRPGEPVLLAGDFNDWSGRLDRVVVDELGFKNAFASTNGIKNRTWHSRRPLFELDRIYVKNLRTTQVRRLVGPPWSHLSDHLPVLAELEPEVRAQDAQGDAARPQA